jgi:Lipocalin-like domain
VEEIMKRLCLGAVIVVGLALPAFGQSTLREQLVGAWTLVSCSGAPWCANPNGIHILDASGHYTTINALPGRPKFTEPSRPRDAYSAEEYKAAAVGLQANFGTWSVNEADKTITYDVDGALFPNVEGMDFKTGTVGLSGDELKIGSTIVWRRIKK